MINEKKISIIRCVNNSVFYEEQDKYIENILVPEGYELDVLSIADAPSMCAGYNEGMKASDAKYKIYMHQDIFLYKKDFLQQVLEIFKDSSIGMVGLVGTIKLGNTCIPWEYERTGRIVNGLGNHMNYTGTNSENDLYKEVEVVDGMLMATQVDIPWREDIFKGWDMYDTSQSMEMHRAGYKVVVPNQKTSWAIHDEDVNNLTNYYKWLEVFRKEYKDDI